MSGRRRRAEIFWDNNEEKPHSAEFYSNVSPGRSQNWSKSEAHDDLMHGNFSRSPSWEGNRNGPKDADIRRDRNRMYSHPNYDGFDQPQSTHPSDDDYGPPYRSRDKGIGGNVQMSRDRSKSLNRSRSRSRERVSRSSRESFRGHRHETNASYSNMRNNPKDFHAGNITENWSRRTEYKNSSRYNDYPQRSAHSDHRNSKIACRYFAAGNCNRDNCRFSHDVPAAKSYNDNRNLGNKNRTWHDDHHPRDDLNENSNIGQMEKKSWNSSLWDDVKSGDFDATSRLGHGNNTWDSRDDKKKLLDGHASRRDVGQSYPNLDNKKPSWNGPTWADVKSCGFDETSRLDENNTTWDSKDDRHASQYASSFHDVRKSDPNFDNKKPSWNGPTWADVKSGGFDETSRLNENNTTWDSKDDRHASHNASSFHDDRKSDPNLDNKKPSWDGPTSWNDVKSGGIDEALHRSHTAGESKTTWDDKKLLDGHASGFHDVGKSCSNLDNKKTSWDGVSGSGLTSVSNPFHKHEDSGKEYQNDNNATGRISANFGSNIDGNKTKKWDGPSWDEVSEPVTDDRNWGGPGLNNIVHEEANPQIVTSKSNLIQSVHDMNHSSLIGPAQSHMPFDGPQVQGAYGHMENHNKSEVVGVSQPQAVNDTSLTSQQANPPPTEMSHKEPQLPQLYSDLQLTDAIDYLKSLPNSAYNQDSRAKEEPTGMLSGSVTQQKHDSKVGQMGVMEKKIVEGFDKKRLVKKEDKLEEGDDEKAMRQFKVGLVDLVKEILKPKWKEGKMSREVHKNVVKKVVEKVTTTIQIPKTQPKMEQYLAYSKPKITKLVEAYMEKLSKA